MQNKTLLSYLFAPEMWWNCLGFRRVTPVYLSVYLFPSLSLSLSLSLCLGVCVCVCVCIMCVCVFVCVCIFQFFSVIGVKAYQGFPTRMVYLYYKSCLRYTILIGNPRYVSLVFWCRETFHWLWWCSCIGDYIRYKWDRCRDSSLKDKCRLWQSSLRCCVL